MEFLIGPQTGDLAGNEPVAARVDKSEVGGPLSLLLLDDAEFPNAADYGFRTAAENPSGEWRRVETVIVDASLRYEVDLYAITGRDETGHVNPETDLVKIAGAVFPDPHPQSWWDAIHDESGLIMVAVGPIRKHLTPGGSVPTALLQHMRVGVCGLLVRAYPSGIGTRPPS